MTSFPFRFRLSAIRQSDLSKATIHTGQIFAENYASYLLIMILQVPKLFSSNICRSHVFNYLLANIWRKLRQIFAACVPSFMESRHHKARYTRSKYFLANITANICELSKFFTLAQIEHIVVCIEFA